MADTVESLFLNTSLGSTELDDGEHTVLTTNSSTRYVIKDVLTNGTSGLRNTYLDLNGFNVGSLSSNLNGSLIVPPNSTLKIKSTDYPVVFTKTTRQMLESINTRFAQTTFYNSNLQTDPVGSTTSYVTTNSPNGVSNITRAVIDTANNGTEYLWFTTNDNNSSQQLRYYNLSNNSNSTIRSESYKPFGIYDHPTYGLIGIYFESSTLRYTDLKANPTGSNWQSPSYFGGGLRSNSYSPVPTSSYPRGFVEYGYFWYIPSSGYEDIYAVNLNNGAFHRFDYNGDYLSGNQTFMVTYRSSDDKFIFWKNTGQSTMTTEVSSATRSTLDAYNSTSQRVDTLQDRRTFNLTNNMANDFSRVQMSAHESGDLIYMDTSNFLNRIDRDGAVVSRDTTSTFSIGGSNLNAQDFHRLNVETLTTSQASAAGLSSPTFGLHILGIKMI